MSVLAELYRAIAACQDCELARQRTNVVPGEGDEDADLLFIGEAPGWHEDRQGRPFVGPAGQFLDHLLASIGLRREEVYIANVVKCRPPQNREPLPAEIQACRRWLDQQIETIQPRMIVTLGRYSLARYLPDESISKIHGSPRRLEGIILYPMYHPAAALHQGSLRSTIETDMLKIPRILAQTGDLPREAPEAQQLSLF
jgi:uracil-DNA glycosylase